MIKPILINNFGEVQYFYKREMRVKENKPTKLFSTNIVTHKAAIFGLIMNYKPSGIHFFFDSLTCTGYNGTVILLYAKIDNNTINYIISFSEFFEIVMIPLQFTNGMRTYSNCINSTTLISFYRKKQVIKKIFGFIFQKVDFLELPFVCGDFRFEIAYFLYKNHFFDEYDFLFITDISDVIFQLDIRLFNYTEGVYVTEEADVSVRQVHTWLTMFNADYKPFEQKVELCVGTLILVGQKSFSFLCDLHNKIKDNLHLVVSIPNFQGPLNFLIYNNSYYHEYAIHFITTSHGIINSLGKFNFHIKNFNSKKYFYFKVRNIYDVYYHDKNYLLYNQDYQKLAALHHTKYVPIILKMTFKSFMKICEKMSPNIFYKINNYSS